MKASNFYFMKKLKFAVIGTGFWAYYQLKGWMELTGAEPIAFFDQSHSKAKTLAAEFKVNRTYDNVDELFDNHAHELDFVDIITNVDSHFLFTEMAAARKLHVICQKPMAPDFAHCKKMVEICQKAGIKFLIHENFRWQAPLRKLKEKLEAGVIGKPFKARVTFASAFPVFENQPVLAELEQFILADIGSHIFDICRFLFGETHSLYCQTDRINPGIKGEDVANALMRMKNGIVCYAEMSYASILEKEAFPQTLVSVEGEGGSIVLAHDFTLKTTTKSGTSGEICDSIMYPWVNPDYAVVHSSIVDCNRNLLSDLQGWGKAETTGEDNLETIRLIYAAYESARDNKVVYL